MKKVDTKIQSVPKKPGREGSSGGGSDLDVSSVPSLFSLELSGLSWSASGVSLLSC